MTNEERDRNMRLRIGTECMRQASYWRSHHNELAASMAHWWEEVLHSEQITVSSSGSTLPGGAPCVVRATRTEQSGGAA